MKYGKKIKYEFCRTMSINSLSKLQSLSQSVYHFNAFHYLFHVTLIPLPHNLITSMNIWNWEDHKFYKWKGKKIKGKEI
jgi:hypothetical protein